MNKVAQLFKNILADNQDDLKYVLLIGLPSLLFYIWMSVCANLDHLY